jgi:hypothetical protein
VYRDITGSAVWTWANPGTGTSNDIVFYDDVIYASNGASHTGSALNLGALADGIFGCFNSGVVCTNVVIVQNTIANIGWGSGIYLCDIGTGCTATVQNNLWYQTYGTVTNTVAHPAGVGIGAITWTYNSVIESGTGCTSGTGNVCDASGPNPFVSWTTGNFNLASENANWNNRLALSSPYTTDAKDVAWTTDRGAYQFVSATPAPPTNVTGTAVPQ